MEGAPVSTPFKKNNYYPFTMMDFFLKKINTASLYIENYLSEF